MQRQRKQNSPKLLVVRPLTEVDLSALNQKAHRPDLRRILDSHHMVARYVASGMSNYEIAETTGYSLARIVALKSAPAMIELIAQYRKDIHEGWVSENDALTRLALSNTLKAERQIADKLDEADAEGETLSVRELVSITSDRMDRFGYGKKSANLNINVDFAAKLEAAVARTRKLAAE